MAARTVSEIENSIITEKENNRPTLVGLTSTSSASIWRMWVNVVANIIHDHEVLLDIFLKEVTDAADAAIPGTIPWYAGRALVYQFGDVLEINNTTS